MTTITCSTGPPHTTSPGSSLLVGRIIYEGLKTLHPMPTNLLGGGGKEHLAILILNKNYPAYVLATSLQN